MLEDSALDALITEAAALGMSFAARRATLAVEEKDPGQFVSEADRAIETLIRRRLAVLDPGVAILGEEGGGSLGPATTGWVLDPIDGTTNFLCGMPIWAISIGYMVGGEPVLGAIALPELGLVLTARKGGGVRRNGVAWRPAAPAGRVRMFALGENDFDPIHAVDVRAASLRAQDRAVVRYYCAVFSLANVALGRLDGYIEHGCRLWDIAAAWIICREAGVAVSAAEIAPGRYSIDARWSSPA